MSITTQRMLSGVYYPYSRCTNEQTIKRAILVFDDVFLIDPLPHLLRRELRDLPLAPTTVSEAWQSFEEDYQLLIEKGVLKLHDPTDEVRRYEALLTRAFEADNSDDSYWRECLHTDLPETWYILKERVPPPVFSLFQDSWSPGYIAFVMEQAKYAFGERPSRLVWSDQVPAHCAPELPKGGTEWDHFVKASPRQIFDHIFRKIFSDGEVGFELDHRNYKRRKATAKDKEGHVFSCLFSFAHGSSLALNQALLSSELVNAAPFTDSEIHHRLLCLKYKRSAAAGTDAHETYANLGIASHPENLARLSLLSFSILDSLVPDEVLSQLTVEQCYRYRQACEESRLRFVETLFELDAAISSDLWGSTIQKEIRALINGKVIPEARKLEDRMADIRVKLFANLAFATGTVALPTLLATVCPGIGPMLALLLGSSAVAGGTLALAAKEIKDSMLERRSVKRHGLSYLIGVPR